MARQHVIHDANRARGQRSGRGEKKMSDAMEIYSGAVKNFHEFTTASIDNLVKARQSYEEALRASDEIRKTLASNDESIISVMTRLQQIVGLHVTRQADPAKLIEMPNSEKLPLSPDMAETDKMDGQNDRASQVPKLKILP
jgi:hypothetical protein